VYNYEFWRPGMVLEVTHVRRKNLPPYVNEHELKRKRKRNENGSSSSFVVLLPVWRRRHASKTRQQGKTDEPDVMVTGNSSLPRNNMGNFGRHAVPGMED
jgi:hypothetical protein